MARGIKKSDNNNGKSLATRQSVNQVVKGICDIMRRSNCQGAMQYVPELSWMLFLRILDDLETRRILTGPCLNHVQNINWALVDKKY